MNCKIIDSNTGCHYGRPDRVRSIILFDVEDTKISVNDDGSYSLDGDGYATKSSISATFSEEVVDGSYYEGTLKFQVFGDDAESVEFFDGALRNRYYVTYEYNGKRHILGDLGGASVKATRSFSNKENWLSVEIKGYSRSSAPLCEYTGKKTPYWVGAEPISCLTDGSGYGTYNYVVKVDNEGNPLDADDALCSYSGNPQAAYKLDGTADGDYDILSVFEDFDVVQGMEVTQMADACQSGRTMNVSVVKKDGQVNWKLGQAECPYQGQVAVTGFTEDKLQMDVPDGIDARLVEDEGYYYVRVLSIDRAGTYPIKVYNVDRPEVKYEFNIIAYKITVNPDPVEIGGGDDEAVAQIDGGGEKVVFSSFPFQYLNYSWNDDRTQLTLSVADDELRPFDTVVNLKLEGYGQETFALDVHVSEKWSTAPVWVKVSEYCELN